MRTQISLARAWSSLYRNLTDGRLSPREVSPGVVQLRLSNRLITRLGMEVTPYLFDDILIDTGFARAGNMLPTYLSRRTISAICCTHHHEDHVGGAGPLARVHRCPVFLARPEASREEGVGSLLPYRWIYWGPPPPYSPVAMPEVITSGGGRTLQVIPTPGHSRTHSVFYERRSGLLFSGDLFITGGATAVMSHENPYLSIRSLRRIAALTPSRMLTGHGLIVPDPAPRLLDKASRIEAAAEQAVALHHRGVAAEEAVRRIFANGHSRDRWMTWMTGGEFSRYNFIRACVAHADVG